MRISTTLLLAAALACGAAHADDETLTGEQIASAVSGKRMAGTRPDGASVRLRFSADGALSVQDGHATDSGKWSVQDGKLCLQVARWGYDGCGKLVRTGGKLHHFYPDGQRENLALD